MELLQRVAHGLPGKQIGSGPGPSNKLLAHGLPGKQIGSGAPPSNSFAAHGFPGKQIGVGPSPKQGVEPQTSNTSAAINESITFLFINFLSLLQ